MIKLLSILILKLCGWKREGVFPEGNKYVVIAAPHTSKWDFIWGKLYYNSISRGVKYMIKEKYFYFPLGIVLKLLGAIPVKTNTKVSLHEQMITEFRRKEKFVLTITPEGTRKKVKRWKRGFYYIAKGANVPIVVGFLDYEKKTLGVLGTYQPTEDTEADLKAIKQMYRNVGAKHPERFAYE